MSTIHYHMVGVEGDVILASSLTLEFIRDDIGTVTRGATDILLTRPDGSRYVFRPCADPDARYVGNGGNMHSIAVIR